MKFLIRERKRHTEKERVIGREGRERKQPQGKTHIPPAHITHKISCTVQPLQNNVMTILTDMARNEQLCHYLKKFDKCRCGKIKSQYLKPIYLRSCCELPVIYISIKTASV